MSEQTAKVLAHVSNLGVVQMPGRNYPGVVIQGDTLVSLLFSVINVAKELKKLNAEEDALIEALSLLQQLAGILEY